MDGTFPTLQGFMTFTKAITYIIMVISLLGIAGFWSFLNAKDDG